MKFFTPRALRTFTTSFSALCSVAPRRLKSLAALPLLLLLAAAGTAHAQAAASFTGAQITLPISGLSYPQGVAIGPNGNVYIADSSNNALKEVVAVDGQIPANPTINTLGSFYGITGVAVDGSGNVYVATGVSQTVQEVVAVGGQIPASPTIRTLGSGFSSPYGIAVDIHGNVYVADSNNNVIKEMVAVSGQIPASPTINTLGSGFSFPVGVAVDAGGNVFVADSGNNAIKEIVAVAGQIPASPTINTLGSGFSGPKGVAVDGSGNVFVADTSNRAIKEIVAVAGQIPASPTINAVGSGFNYTYGVAVDSSGNVFVADTDNSAIKEIMRAGVNFRAEPIGTTSSALTLNFTFSASGAIGAPAVLTQGAANLDFTDAGTGSCTTNGTSHTYNVGDTCTVNVTFTPKYAGPRYGAVVLYNATGAPIATGYVYGTGLGPQVIFLPGTQSVISNSLTQPFGVAVDGSGNVYVADYTNGAVHKYAPSGSGYTQQADVATGMGALHGVAVDGGGNVYVADTGAKAVHKYAPNGSGYTQQADVASGLNIPYSVGIDGSGNVYIGVIDAVHKYAPNGSGGYTQQADVANTGVNTAIGVAVDASGDVYVAAYHGAVYKYAPNGSGGYTQQADVVNGLGLAGGVAVDGSGNVYFTDPSNKNVFKEDYADAPSLSFAATNAGSTSADSPRTVTLVNGGNAALSFPVPGTGNNPSFPANFSLDSTTTGTCPLVGSSSSTAGTLAAGASCTLPVSFKPTAVGSISGSLVLTDTNLNAAAPTYTTQSIQLSGTGNPGAATHFSVSAPAGATAGTSFNFTVTALDAYGNTASRYSGTVHFTSTDPLAVLPADSTFTSGVGTFSVTLTSSGMQSVVATDTSSTTITGSAMVLVGAVSTTLTPTVTPSSSYFYGTVPSVSVALTPSSATGITAAAFTAMLDGTTALTVSSTSTNVFTISGIPTNLGVGSHTIQVSFAGTTSYTASSVSIPLTVTSLPTYVVTVLTDPVSGTAANCSNQSLGGATPDTNCSLRDAIAAANANPAGTVSTITFLPALTQNASTANPAVITLSGSYLDLTGSMKIFGPGANLLQISGNHASRVLQVEAGATGIIQGLFFIGGNGNGVDGGGLINKGAMTLSRCVVSGNSAGGYGGGIYSFQEVSGSTVTLTVTQSTIANNTAVGFGGGIAANNNSSVTLDNSTIANNTADGVGGGMWNGWTVPTTITNSTVTGNTANSWGGGLDTYTAPTIANSIVSGNTMAPSGDINTVGSITDNGGNIINQSSATIQVSPLGYYGGPTPTIVPVPGSPAIGAGIASSSNTSDQRGVARPTTGATDSGAVQTNNYTLAFTTQPPAQVTAGNPFTAAVTLSENGAPLSVAGVSIGLGAVINGTTATALPALTTNASGVASSSALTLNSSGTGYTLVSTLPIASSKTISATSNAFDVIAVATTLTPTVTPSAAYTYGTAAPTVSVALTPSSATGLTPSMFSAVLDGTTSLTVTSSGANNFDIAGIPAGLGGGAHRIRITFAGTSMYGASSVTVPLAVTKAGSKPSLSAGSSSIGAGTSVTLTAQVASTTTGTPTGTVSFYDGSTLLGTASLSNGTASYTTTALTTVATHTLTAAYGGDANFAGSATGTGVNVAVAALDFNFQASGALSATVGYGAPATFSYTIAPTISGVYPGPVNFAVSGPSTGVSYSLSQTTIPANAGPQTITLTVTTAASTAAVRERQLWGIGGTAVALGVLLPIGMLRRGRQLTRSAGRRLLLALLVTAASVTALGLSGCGGGNRNLPQSYSVTVTATSGSVSHASIVSVLVR